MINFTQILKLKKAIRHYVLINLLVKAYLLESEKCAYSFIC